MLMVYVQVLILRVQDRPTGLRDVESVLDSPDSRLRLVAHAVAPVAAVSSAKGLRPQRQLTGVS